MNLTRPEMSLSRFPLLRSLLAFALAIGLSLTVSARATAATSTPGDSLADPSGRIASLRGSGHFREALEVAREWRRLTEQSAPSPPETLDARVQIETLTQILGLPIRAQREVAVADSLSPVISAAFTAGKLEAGIVAVRRQLEIRQRLLGPDAADVGQSLGNYGFLLRFQGHLKEAEARQRAGLAIQRRRLGSRHPDVGASLANLGGILREQARLLEAEPCLREALAIDVERLGDADVSVAYDHNELGRLLQAEGDLGEAMGHLQRSMQIIRAAVGESSPDFAGILDNLASVSAARGEYLQALALRQRSLGIRRTTLGPGHPLVGQSLNNVGRVLLQRGDIPGALDHFREALEIAGRTRGERHPEVAAVLANLGSALRADGDLSGALTYLDRAYGILSAILPPQHPDLATNLMNRGGLLREQGNWNAAESCFVQTLEIYTEAYGENHPAVAGALQNLGQLRLLEGRLPDAQTLFERALSIRLRVFEGSHPDVAATLATLAETACRGGNAFAAESLYARAAGALESARPRAGFEPGSGPDLAGLYRQLALVRLSQGRGQAAWEAAEHGQGRLLADFLLASRGRPLDRIEHARQDSLVKIASSLEAEVAAYRRAPVSEADEELRSRLEATRDRLVATETQLTALQQSIALRHPITEGQPYTLTRIQTVLDAETAVIGWVQGTALGGAAATWGYVLRRTGPVIWVPLPPGDAKGGFAARLHEFLVEPGGSTLGVSVPAGLREAEVAVWESRFAGLDRKLGGVHRLVVIPSGDMLGLPIECLRDRAGRLLVDRYSVSYAPSATILAWLLTRSPVRRATTSSLALLVGDPDPAQRERRAATHVADGATAPAVSESPLQARARLMRGVVVGDSSSLRELPPLAGAREEVLALRPLFPGATTLLGPEASEARLTALAERDDLGRYQFIHLAMHAVADDRRPENSALVLSQANLEPPLAASLAGHRIFDGLLTAGEIVREWHISADLVTLSGCETGLGRATDGEGYLGLAHAFFQAGARALVVSLWPVDDEATRMLMERFYRDLQSSGPTRAADPAAALREARIWLRDQRDPKGGRRYEHPYFWAGFVLIGGT